MKNLDFGFTPRDPHIAFYNRFEKHKKKKERKFWPAHTGGINIIDKVKDVLMEKCVVLGSETLSPFFFKDVFLFLEWVAREGEGGLLD